MQGAIASHLVKRGVSFASKCLKHKQDGHNQAANVDKWIQIQNTPSPAQDMAQRFKTPGAVITLGLTALVFIILGAALEYSIRFVATNLAIVENTEDSGRIALTSNEPDAPLSKTALLDDFDGEEQKLPIGEFVPSKPITSKLRTTFKHLHSVGGFRSRFRGLGMAIFYQLALIVFTALFNVFFAALGPVGMWMASTAAAVVSCNIHAAWTHATIAAPSSKSFFQRFLARKVACQMIMPTLRLQTTIGLMHASVVGSGYLAVAAFNASKAPHWVSANLAFLPVATGILTGLLLVIPSYIALIRTEASLMPEDMTAIVPFDRTFGGRMLVQSDTCGRRYFQTCTVRGAWTLFSRDTYKRVLKMQVRFVAIIFALTVVFTGIFMTEAYVISGGKEELNKLWVQFQATRQ
ncbi:hypothetical protein BT63DRAFT_17168 [Microthyrium microscopicum]|uniref:Uncharacterized protein n=1 Tax=Microthyrium microscopicum TaxID=703497 RepID=A0A6A6UQV2_9PEZI|nr:hypothetical protein BT63DRAFT_17168 [Microthyrium microscopicum]